MNVDSNSNTSPCKVTSKYFANQPVDESLTDFQESKKSCTGAKNSKATNNTKVTKPKKPTKRVRGQKDTRTALKRKQNDLVTYTKEFDEVCKKSGIDVDPEQLQLAIALSKSLQTETNSDNSQKALQFKERSGRIRRTLKEYGFKVPEITAGKKLKKHRKPYKLLLTTDTEKLQIISDRYSQLLFRNLDNFNKHLSVDNSKAFLYDMTTNITYEQIKDNSRFYFNDLIQKSTSNSCLLRDWADIPGRPVSPDYFENLKMSVSEVEYSQDELDVMLSGSLKCTKTIMHSKQCHPLTTTKSNEINCNNTKQHSNSEVPIIIIDSKVSDKEIVTIDDLITKTQPVMVTQLRCFSPDIFDDDASSIVDMTKSTYTISQDKNENTDFMDLTECVKNVSQKCLRKNIKDHEKPNSQLSQKSDSTKRKSDDFMEITECVSRSLQPMSIVNDIDLTQNTDNKETTIIAIKRNETVDDIENMDLTQSSKSSDDMPFINLSNKKSLEDTIIINADEYESSINKTLGKVKTGSIEEVLDLTDEKHMSPVKKKYKNNESFFEEFSHEHFDSEELIKAEYNDKKTNSKFTHVISENPDMNLTKSSNSLRDKCNKVQKYCAKSIERIENEYDNIVRSHLPDVSRSKEDNIDLTQNSSSSDEISNMDKELLDKRAERIEYNSKHCEIYNNLHHISRDTENNSIDLTHTSNLPEETNKVEDLFESENDLIGCNEKSDVNSNIHDGSEYEENDIDLTQTSNSSAEVLNQNTKTPLKPFNNGNLGKKDDISIDYDEICSVSNRIADHLKNDLEYSTAKSVVYEIADENEDRLESSQNCEVFDISDRELDYSLYQSKQDYFNFGGISIMDDFSNIPGLSKSTIEMQTEVNNFDASKSFLPDVDIKRKEHDINETQNDPNTVEANKSFNVVFKEVETPKNEYIIKTDDVTPMLDYESMSTPQRNRELGKYGLKPFKRKRAIQLLTHLYNQTHPTVEPCNEELPSPSKKLKQDINYTTSCIPNKLLQSPKNSLKQTGDCKENIYEVTNELPDLREIHCCVEDWVFQKREKAKVHSCRVPLHIAFYNYVSCRRGLREAILRYEPVNIDVIHKELASYGHRYDPKELLKFMDKKCITVKTTDNNSRNNRF